MLDFAEGTGVATYTRTLVATLREAGIGFELLLDPALGVASVLDRAKRLLRAVTQPRTRTTATSRGLVAWDAFARAQVRFTALGRVTELVASGETGICHWTYPLPLRLRGWRNVYTLHDAIPLTHSQLTGIDPVRYRRLIEAITPCAARFVTVSNAARDDIVAVLGIDERTVTVLGQAVPDDSRHGAPLPPGLSPGGYFLALGAIEPRKNLPSLIAAHAASGAQRPLVIVGPDGWRAEASLRAISSAGNAMRLPFTDRATVSALIRHARAVLFPSLAEGFGLPIAEAMTSGTPVLTSAGGATAETAGGAALLVDPADEAALASAIDRLDREDNLCADLAEAGLRRAPAFSTIAYAERLRAFYADIDSRGERTDG